MGAEGVSMEILLLFLVFLFIIWFCYYFLKVGKGSDIVLTSPVAFPQTSQESKRKHPRTTVNWPVSMETADGIVEGEIKNISLGGAFICCEHPLSIGVVFRLTMKAPDGEPIEASARVVWSNSHLPKEKVIHRGMGVQFLKMSDRHLHCVRGLFSPSELK